MENHQAPLQDQQHQWQIIKRHSKVNDTENTYTPSLPHLRVAVRPAGSGQAWACLSLPPRGSRHPRGVCWPAAHTSARPFGVTLRGPLLGLQDLKSSADRGVATLLEAGGRVGEAPGAVSWGGSLGPRAAVGAGSQGTPACVGIHLSCPFCWVCTGRLA